MSADQTNPMSEQQLADILTRAEAATPGRWESDGAEIYGTLGDVLMIDLWVGETLDIDNQEQSNANAAFIAAARTDVPELVAEVQFLRAQVAELEAQVRSLAVDAEGGLPGHCPECGEASETWCPDCGCCKAGCFGGHENNPCAHSNAPWAVSRG